MDLKEDTTVIQFQACPVSNPSFRPLRPAPSRPSTRPSTAIPEPIEMLDPKETNDDVTEDGNEEMDTSKIINNQEHEQFDPANIPFGDFVR